MKTILLTINYWQGAGGVERVVVNLANAFKKRNYRVIILSFFQDQITSLQYEVDEQIEKCFLPAIDTSSFSLFKAILSKSRLFLTLRKFIKTNHIDFVIKSELSIPPLFFSINGVKTCTLFHSSYCYYSFSFRKRINLWGANYNIVLTSKELVKWRKIFHNIVVIPNMVVPLKKESQPERTPTILSVGHLNKNKGFERLIHAYLPLIQEFPSWKLVIVGNDWGEKNKLQALINDHCVSQQIIIKPGTNEIAQEYLSSSIFAMASYQEGFPMVLIEAMDCGLPCIAFDINTGPSDIIQQGKNGFLIEDENLQDMRKALKQLMIDPDLRHRMGQCAKESIMQFSEDIIINKWLKLIEK